MKHVLILAGLFLSLSATAQTNNCNFGARPEIQQPSCADAANGEIQINVDNPLGLLLNYSWTKILAIPLPLPLLLGNVARDLSTGDYQVIISNGLCADTLKVNLPAPAPLQVLDTAICGIGGAINLLDRISGGNGDYKIIANTVFGDPYSCNECATPTVNVVKKSIIDVEVVDRKGCQTKQQVEIDVLDSLIADKVVMAETCTNNGAITVKGRGGSGNYLYTLNNNIVDAQRQEYTFKNLRGNAEYDVKVRDTKGCRTEEKVFVPKNSKFTPANIQVQDASCYGSRDGGVKIQTPANTYTGYTLNSPAASLQNRPEFANLPPGRDTVYVFEGADCYVGYPVTINEPDSLALAANATETNCPGSSDGVLELQANGGNGGFQYSIDGTNFQPRNTFTNLNAGNYKVVVRDQKGCTAIDVASINEPPRPNVGPQITASCPDVNSGSIVIVESGKLLYGSYSFSLDSITWQSKNLFEGLAPGVYNVFVRYPNGCVYKVTAIVPEVQAPGVFFRIQPVSCPDAEDGAIVVEVTTNGETNDFLYSLDGEDFGMRNAFKDLTAGDYNLYMRDSLDCIFTYPFTIEAPQAPAFTFQVEAISCFGGKDGKVTIQTRGGQAPFTYALNGINFQTNPVFDGLPTSNYVAVVRDSNGCLYAQEVNVAQPTPIQATFTKVDETCGAQNGVLVCTASGGTAPYKYSWDTGDTTSVLTGLSTGNYVVNILDANQCAISQNAKVESQPGPIVIGDLTNAPCHGMPTGAIDLSVIGGVKPFQFKWSNGSNAQKINNLAAGNYTVTVTDNNQCASIKLFNLYEPAPIELQAQTGPSGDLWFINLICSGGVAPYTYQWSTGETTEDVFDRKPATYTVTVTDQQNCSQTLNITVGTTAVNEPAWASTLKIFPNPTVAQLHILIESPDYQETTALLYDINGRIILQHLSFYDNQIILNIGHLPKGVYWLRLARNESVLYRKIVKQ